MISYSELFAMGLCKVQIEIGQQKCNSCLRAETHFCRVWSNPISNTLPGLAFICV